MRLVSVAPVLALLSLASSALGQAPPGAAPWPPPPPPPGYSPYPFPYGYPYPPPNVAPPPAQPAPFSPGDWKDGDPVPPGYHVEDRPRKGLVTAGYITLLVPYAIGATGALSADFRNESAWLLLPVVGPWMTIGRRDYGCHDDSGSSTGKSASCAATVLGDVFLTMALIMDGTAQAAGATLLLVGYNTTKPTLVRDGASFRLSPTRVGSGYGLGLSGAF